MRERKRSLTFFLMALFIIGSLPITNSVSAEDEVDNWPENDAWLHIELISWSANETVEWDNNGGLPDPMFKICIVADGDNLDCINTPTWENQMTLNNSWNYSLDIPDYSNILNITIECEDNDALNDDECDMNSELNEWKLFAEYNWSATPSLTVTGNGDGDGNETWKNAASTWNFTIGGFGDEDGDGVPDTDDTCPGFDDSDDFDGDGFPSGCDDDDDGDGALDADDLCANTPLGALVDWGCPMDEDEDGVYDGLDLCPNSVGFEGVDSNGCDLDSDNDGIPDFDDTCANTPQGAAVDYTGCPMDSDFDGVYDGIDECPSSNNPSPSDMDKSSEVDSNGCFIDSAGSETNSGSAPSGCLGMIVMIGAVVFVVRKVRSPKQEQVFYPLTQPVISPIHRQSVPSPQVSPRERELENRSRQAQIEAQRLRQQLANQAQITQELQSEAAQKQMSEAALIQKQRELAIAQQEKEELEAKLAEAEKNTSIVQNITYNIQDSAISGDITNKINRNDLE